MPLLFSLPPIVAGVVVTCLADPAGDTRDLEQFVDGLTDTAAPAGAVATTAGASSASAATGAEAGRRV